MVKTKKADVFQRCMREPISVWNIGNVKKITLLFIYSNIVILYGNYERKHICIYYLVTNNGNYTI